MVETPELVPQSVLAAEKRTSSAIINPQSDEQAYALAPHSQDTEESFGRAPAADLDTRQQVHHIENKPGTSNHGANIRFQNGNDETSGGRLRGSAKKQAVQKRSAAKIFSVDAEDAIKAKVLAFGEKKKVPHSRRILQLTVAW